MAYVAFDLDNTLGFFGLTNKLGNLWSKEAISNPEQSARPIKISRKLEIKLSRAREFFAKSLLKDKNILFTVLRPNLDAMILPLLEAKRKRKLNSVIIYSNTGSDYSMELAKYLIEEHYKCRGFFDLMANHWHPLRTHDHRDAQPGEYVEPLKTIETLQKLFKRASYGKAAPLTNILFVDDRDPKHELQKQEPEGLTYLVPTRFTPTITPSQRRYILFLAMYALNEQGLLSSEEYLTSPFCNRRIIYDFTKHVQISGLDDLLDYVRGQMETEESPDRPWRRDTEHITTVIKGLLENI